MICKFKCICVLLVLSLTTSLACGADRKLVWNKDPITLVLPVGEEVRVTFPTDVILQIPVSVMPKLESLAPNQQLVYWRANESFDKARVIATSADNMSVYLVDLVASESGHGGPVIIEDPDRIVSSESNNQESSGRSSVVTDDSLGDPAEIVLTRFAAQTLYAPSRLVPVNGSIQKADAMLPPDFPLMRSQHGETYKYKVAGAWSGYGYYLTAILVINQGITPVHINPGLIQGNFSHITPQHLSLGPTGTIEDRTTIYLISSSPFASAIQEDGYGY